MIRTEKDQNVQGKITEVQLIRGSFYAYSQEKKGKRREKKAINGNIHPVPVQEHNSHEATIPETARENTDQRKKRSSWAGISQNSLRS